MNMRNKTIIITGGGGGIGSSACYRYALEGGRVAILDRDLAAAQSVANAISEKGGKAQAYQCDITDRTQVDAAVNATIKHFGPIDVLVNNAGWDVFKPFLKTQPNEWERLININLVGALHMHHAVLPGMVERKSGRIVTVASDAARGGSSGEAVYAACKAGLVALTKTLAREHARHNITLNVVCPGPTDTALLAGFAEGARDPAKLMEAFKNAVPMGRIAQPDDLAGALLFFGSDDAAYITGQVISVSGGLTMHG